MTDPQHNDPLLRELLQPRSFTTRESSSSICERCGSDASAIAETRLCGTHDWVIRMRCGDCGSWQELVVSHGAMARLEYQVMTGWHAIERDLGALVRQRMLAETSS